MFLDVFVKEMHVSLCNFNKNLLSKCLEDLSQRKFLICQCFKFQMFSSQINERFEKKNKTMRAVMRDVSALSAPFKLYLQYFNLKQTLSVTQQVINTESPFVKSTRGGKKQTHKQG